MKRIFFLALVFITSALFAQKIAKVDSAALNGVGLARDAFLAQSEVALRGFLEAAESLLTKPVCQCVLANAYAY